MDKNKSRSDLLKAGRKKLQQFREKKDGKGGSSSHGIPSKKSSKSEQHQFDTDATSSASRSTVPLLPEVEDVSNVDSYLLVVDSDSVENSLAPETDFASVDPSSALIMPEEGIVDASLTHDAELPPLQSTIGDADSTVSKNKENTQIVDAEEPRAMPSATLGALVLEGETKHADNSGITNLTASSASVDIAEEVAEMDMVNMAEREELLPSQKVIPDASLIQARGDQVTDVGTMKEADDLGLKTFDRSGEPEIEGDGKLVLSDLGGIAATLRESDATPATSYQVENQLKDAVEGFPVEKKSGILFFNYVIDQNEGAQADAENKTVTEMCGRQYILEDSLMTMGKAHERSLETEVESSKGPISNAEMGNSGLILPEYCHPDSFERLKEELYLANFGRDIFHLQLKEMSDMQMEFDHQKHQLVDEISLLRASLNEDQEQKECLTEELAHCKSELQAAANRRGELENQVHSVKAEALEFSSRAHELQICLERSQGDLSNLSVELADCKGLVATLQVENGKLKGTLASMIDNEKKLVEEKQSCLHENENLSLGLADCKVIVASLQIENSNLSETLTSVTEERKKFEEENESHACEYARISRELTDCKGLMSALQVENGNINLSLSLITEEMKKLEEGKEYVIRENERLSNELLVLQKKFPSDSEDHTRYGRISSLVLEKPSSDDPHASVFLKVHLEEAEKILQNLEKAIEEIHSEAMSFNRSSGKMDAPGVSKLIQAFESNAQHDELESEDMSLAKDQSPADTFMLIKKHTGKLRTVLQQLPLDAENTKAEQGAGESFKVAATELKDENEASKKNCDNLEATNIELGVLYEAVKQHACEVEAKNMELEVRIEALKQEDNSLKAEYVELGEKVSEYKSKANELLSQLHDLQRNSDEKTSVLEYQLESLRKEATERALILEQEWESTIAQVIKTMGRLDECIVRVSGSAISTITGDGFDVNRYIDASVNATIKVIETLQEKLDAALEDLETVHGSYKEVNEKFNDLVRKNESASVTLNHIYGELRKLLINSRGSVNELEMYIQAGELVNPVDYANYKILVEQLENLLDERLQLQYLNNELNSELMSRTNDTEELNRRCLSLNVIQKKAEDVEGVVNLQNSEVDSDITPASHLETIQQLNALNLQHENEILALKESLSHAEEALTVARSELKEKASELEQSDQRVSSIREKLSIAVGKGKALVVQRDSLKQSLAETSKELEGCSQELQLKDVRLHELETKLKTYMEAGEHVEALESELSYIRNSSTALRESFLLKDSVLQRIEEILEDLDLPEQFHSRGIIEKVDWLARSATGNSLPVTEWDQKSSVGGSYSDAGFVVTDAWKEDAPPSTSSGDDLRRKYEELQNKFYGLAEQTEMLEQSLMERNHMVQRWEELLDKINMPSHLQSVEPEGKIEWLGTALMEADHDRSFLLLKIDKLKNYCGLLTDDLEESQKRISELEAELQAVIHEREHLSERLEILTSDQERILAKAVQFEHENGKLQSEVTGLQEELAEKVGNEKRIRSIEVELHKLKGLVSDALQDPDAKELISGESGTECLEALVRKLIEHYSALSLVKPVLGSAVDLDGIQTTEADANLDESGRRDMILTEKPDVDVLRKDLEEAMHNLIHVKEERDVYMEKQQSLICEVEALDKKREELQEQLIQEGQKSASLREKLNVAVRKGKLLVQQRDSLKQTLEEMNNEVDRLKSEISHMENTLADNEQKIRDLSAYPEMVEALESERLFLRNRLTEAEHLLQEREHILYSTINALGDIDVHGEVTVDDPVEKLKLIGKLLHDLHASLASSEQDSRKSKRAAELLLAELNEVQERNDYLQEELVKAGDELAEISKERDVAEAAKFEALSRLEKLSTVYSEGKQKQYYEWMVLKTCVKELKKGFSDVNSLLADVFSKDLEFLHNLESNMESCLKQSDTTDVIGKPILSAYSCITSSNSENKNLLSMDSWSGLDVPDHLNDGAIVEVCSFVEASLQELKTDIGALKEKLHKHPISLQERASNLSKVMEIVRGEMNFQKKSLEALKRDFMHVESAEKEKDMEIVLLHKNIALLYEACTNSITEVVNKKAELVGNNSVVGEQRMSLIPVTSVDGELPSGGQAHFYSEEYIKAIADRLYSTLKDFAVVKTENEEGYLKEMKTTIADLQRELQEKDIQKDRICSELVSQIKRAEAAGQSYLQDLKSEETRIYDMERQLKVMEEERSLLELKLKEMQDEQATLTELQDRVKSLLDVLPAKDQEIEALMEALDEEEIQMDQLKNKIEELEKVVQQKNLKLQNLEASREKIAKRLSVTMSKFDELHHLSESLLAEIEKLQSQLQDRDAEISFLRQEVTRCTNEVLVASQISNKRDSDEIQEILSWVDTMISRTGVHDLHLDDKENGQVQCKELLQKKISAIISEFVNQQVATQSRDAILQVERSKVQELTHREEVLRKSLHEKESQINMLEDVEDSGRKNSLTSEILEVEPLMNKWTVPGPSTASQVRSLRKVNNDQVAISVDTEPDNSRLEDEDDDKVHGFKSLRTSRIVPRFTRPVTDMVDGLWVSCDRALMRQPALRLSIILYWAVLHTLLASFAF